MSRNSSRREIVRRGSTLATLIGLIGVVALPAVSLNPLQPAARAAAAAFVVDSTGDGADSDVNDGVCNDGSGRCTLRAAIQQANANAGLDTINFNIGTGVQQIIALSAPLPNVSDPVVIDATTQPGYTGTPLIELGGSQPWGLSITAGNSTVRGLSIRGFTDGIRLTVNGGNRVEANYIGVFSDGVRAFPNSWGVSVGSANNVVGGTGAGKGNLVSGNTGGGVVIVGAAATGNVVAGNLIGTGPDGASAVPNGVGVEVRESAAGNFIGGLDAGARNVISGNRRYGVLTTLGAAGITVRGNFIGTNAAGSAQLGNGLTGVFLEPSFGSKDTTTIGGTEPGARNVISGNPKGIQASGQATAGVVIRGNFIGTDASGTAAIGNSTGVELGSWVTLGGSTAGARNVIAGNTVGVQLFSESVTVQGNFIGTDVNGAALPNTSDGIQVISSISSGLIGGDDDGAGNTIAFNGGAGIVIKPTSIATADSPNGRFATFALRRNSIYANGGLGIDLIAPTSGDPRDAVADGPTPNDDGDADLGPNRLQNAPVVTSVSSVGGTNVRGTLNSVPNSPFRIDIYANAACDPSGHGEGQAHLGSVTVTTDAAANASFDSTFPASAVGQVIAATATDAGGNTSEFSLCNEGSAPGSLGFTQAAYDVNEQDGVAVITVTRTLGSASAATVQYSTSGGTAKAGGDYTDSSGTLSFAAGETTKTFGVALTNDPTDEDAETVNLTLSNPGGGVTLGARSTAVLNISDDDPTPQISFVGEVVVAEGNSGTAEAVFTVGLSAPSAKTVGCVYFPMSGGSANSQDFTAKGGSLTFAPGETTKTFSVQVNGDTEVEPDETVIMALAGPSNGHLLDDATAVFGTGVIWDDDAPGIRFSAPRYDVMETDGALDVKVVRRGDTSTTASVSYSAAGTSFPAEGVASNRADFTPAFGKIEFAPGEAEKSFTVLVNDDAYVEGPETVTLQLSNPSDAPAGTTYRANVVIGSDDAAAPDATNNPVGRSDFFVRQHYHDFLNREPDPSGLAHWSSVVNNCGETDLLVCRVNVSGAFFLSIEFTDTGYLIERAYKAAYGDATGVSTLGGTAHTLRVPIIRFDEFLPDTQRISRGVVVLASGWEEQLEANKQAYFLEFVQRSRFLNAFPTTMTPAQFVDRLNQRAGSPLDAAERQNLIDELTANNTTAGRASVLRKAAEDATLADAETNRAFVLMQYFGYMRRNPNGGQDTDHTGYDFWLSNLERFNGNFVQAELVKAFISSTEYRQRFGQ